MAEWLVEEGIGEHRAIRLEGEIVAARLHWPGGLVAGQVEDAKLTLRRAGTSRGTAVFANGESAHVNGLPASASEGAVIRVEVTRPQIREAGRTKIAQCRPCDKPLQPALGLAGQLRAEGESVTQLRRFPSDADWPELWNEVDGRRVEFARGSMTFYPTPAMLLVDIDGTDDPITLASAAVEPLARTLRRWGLGGNIGIDFPTIPEKSGRKRVDEDLARALDDWPHERTAMNGFGFVQIVSRLDRPSLLNHVWQDRAGARARLLLREAERIDDLGDILLSCVNGVAKVMREEWLTELARRTGRNVRLEINTDTEACHAQAVSR